jgi:hypothetical protein
MGAAVRRSSRILTVSEASKRDILEYFNVPPEKNLVIYNGIDERFATPRRRNQIRAWKSAISCRASSRCTLATSSRTRNVERLLDAFHLVRQSGLTDLKLVVIGDDISKYAALRRACTGTTCTSTCGFSDSSPTKCWRCRTGFASVSSFPHLRGFGFRRSKPWRAAHQWSRRTFRRCLRSREMRPARQSV